MSARLYINGAIKGIAENLYPGIKYVDGTKDLIAQLDLRQDQPVMALLTDYQLTRPEISSSYQLTNAFVFFLALPDQFDSRSEQSHNIIATTDIMVDQLFSKLELIFEDLAIQMKDIIKTPEYKTTSETVSGTWVQCTLVVNDCLPNEYPNLSEFFGAIGRDVSPYDWKGILKNANSRIYQ